LSHLIDQVRGYVAIVREFSRNARLVLLALALIGISYGAFSTLFNLYIIELGYDEAFLGLLIAVSAGFGAVVSVPCGLLVDRMGARRGLLLGTAITAIGIVIETTIVVAWVLLVGAAIAAVGVVFIFVAQAPFFAANSTERDRMHLYSVAAAVFVAMSIIGSLFAGFFPDVLDFLWPGLTIAETYRFTLLASGAISGLSLYALLQLRETGRPDLPPTSREVVSQCFHSPAVRRLVLTGLFLSLGGGLIVPFFNVYFQQELGASTGMIGLIRALGITVTVAGSLGAPWLGGRLGLVWAVIIARLLSAPFLLLMGVTPVLVMAAAFFAIRTFMVYMSDPLHTDFSMRIVPPEIRATANSLTFLSWNVTLAVGGWIGGRLIVQSGYDLPFMLGSAITVVAAGVYWLAFRDYQSYGQARAAEPATQTANQD
jgi:predicted MFS family arabinose efflux permease